VAKQKGAIAKQKGAMAKQKGAMAKQNEHERLDKQKYYAIYI
jgi:hypothetical protein